MNKLVIKKDWRHKIALTLRATEAVSHVPSSWTRTPVSLFQSFGSHVAQYHPLFSSPANFHDIFTVHADLSGLVERLEARTGPQGTYYEVEYDIIILFGLTEFKAQYAWIEDVSSSLTNPNS